MHWCIMRGVLSSAAPLDRASTINLISEVDFARLLRRRPSSLNDAIRSCSIFFIEQDGQRRYPSFFVDSAFRRRDLYLICRRLGALPGGSKLQFFTQAKASLGGITPLEALHRGMMSQVLRSAEGFAVR